MHRGFSSTAGLTIVELLVAGIVMTVLLGMTAIFFSSQATVSRRTQARSDANIKARTIAELIVQDLQVAGSTVHFNGAEIASEVTLPCAVRCVSSSAVSSQDNLTMHYATSTQALAASCRTVQYTFTGDTLYRSDVACGGVASPQLLAHDVTALNVQFLCANDPATPVDDPDSCYDAPNDSFPRQATVAVTAVSDNLSDTVSEINFTTAILNLRN